MSCFVILGEEAKPESKMKPTKASTSFSSSTNKHQSTVNKRPTTPLITEISRRKTKEEKVVQPVKAVNILPVLQMFKEGSQGLANVADSTLKVDAGSGSVNDRNNDEDHSGLGGEKDDDVDSGSSSISSGESSGSTSSSIRDDTGPRDVNIASHSEDSYVLPNVVRVSSNTPSASRSAIPLSSEELGLSLGLPLINYSHEDSSNDKDENDQGSTSYDNDDDENEDEEEENGHGRNDDDDDADDGSDKPVKGRTQLVSNRNQPAEPSQGPLATTKSSVYKTTRGSVISALKTKMKSREMLPRGDRKDEKQHNLAASVKELRHTTQSSFHNKGNELATVLHANILESKAETNLGQAQSTVQYVKNGVHGYRHKEASGAVAMKTDSDVKKKQLVKEFKDKDISKGKQFQQDFNDVTRAVITKMKSKSDEKINFKQESQQIKPKKARVAKSSQKIAKASYTETPLQRELSTLFAKDTTKTSFIKSSKKSSFDKLKKLEEQRDRKRHRSKGHPSLCKYQNLSVLLNFIAIFFMFNFAYISKLTKTKYSA